MNPSFDITGLKSWTDKAPIVDYFSENLIKYQRIFLDADNQDDYQQIPIDFDVTHFAVLYNSNNVAIHENKDCSVGTFFIPFLPCNSKEELLNKISYFVKKFGSRHNLNAPELRVFVIRRIQPDGSRLFAIGGTNFRPKSQAIHSLSIQTLQHDTGKVNSINAWDLISREMGTIQESSGCLVIEKTEILPFEERTYPVHVSCRHVLILGPEKENGFLAQHFVGGTKKIYINKNENGSVFKLNTVRLDSQHELDQKIHWLAKIFRELTGNFSVKVVAQFSELPTGQIDASAIAFKNFIKLKPDEDEEL